MDPLRNPLADRQRELDLLEEFDLLGGFLAFKQTEEDEEEENDDE